MGWIALLKGNWRTILGAAALLALAFYIGSLNLRLGIARGDVAKLTGEVAQLKHERESLYQTIAQWRDSFFDLNELADACSQQVIEMKDKAAEAQAKAAEAIKQAEARASARQILIDAARERENGPARTCEQAVYDAKRDLEELL